MAAEKELEQLILDLYDINAVKFGTFMLKSGIESPVYFDLRVIVSYPEIMVRVSEMLWKAVQASDCQFENVCGVPYTALPLATVICAKHKYPMLIRRKEAKDYGTKKMIEGHYKQGDVCLVVEDVVTSGSSVLETVKSLNGEGIVVRDAVVLLDREQGGAEALTKHKIKLHSICGMSKLVSVLVAAEKIDADTAARVKQFIADNSFKPGATQAAKRKMDGGESMVQPAANGDHAKTEDVLAKKSKKVQFERLASIRNSKSKLAAPIGVRTYAERAETCTHPMSKKLYDIMHRKSTNLCLSADVTSASQLLELADSLGPHICVLKTHMDMVEDFTRDTAQQLTQLAEKHHFLLFEDRKFADIGNTVKHQYEGGVHKISEWAHIINAHTLSGPGVITALKQVGEPLQRACLLVAEMSSAGNLISPEYTKATVRMAEENSDFIMGFITQSRLSHRPDFIHMTPGVKLEAGGDSLNQQYLTPAKVIKDSGSDVIIVGRGIISAEDPVKAAISYKEAGFKAYEETL